MFFGRARTPEAENLRDDFCSVGCGCCKFFNVRADLPGVESTCKRLDHKILRFAVPWFKSYDCGQQTDIMCHDFAPAEWIKYLYAHWISVDDYVGDVPDNLSLALTIGKDTSVRYIVSGKEFYDGTFINGNGELRCYGKEYYVKRNDKKKFPTGYELINERYAEPVAIKLSTGGVTMAYLERYAERRLQCAYENACDCLYYGMCPKHWQDCGITKAQRKEVWAVAWYDMGDGCEENGKKSILEIMAEVFS